MMRFYYSPDEPTGGNPTEGDTEAGGQAEPGGGEQSGWRSALDDSLRASPALQKFEDVGTLAKSYVELERHINDKGVRVPGENATPQEIREAMTQLGCPEDVSGLGSWDIPEGLPVDEGFVSHMAQAAWDVGLTPEQWKRLGSQMTGFQAQALRGQAEQGETQQRELVATLEKEWGAETRAHLDLARETAQTIFGDQTAQSMALMTEDGRIGNNPELIKVMAKLGNAMKEAGVIQGRPKAIGGLTPDLAKAEWTQLQTDADFNAALMNAQHPGHEAAIIRRDTLYNAMYSGPDGPTAVRSTGVTVGGKNFS